MRNSILIIVIGVVLGVVAYLSLGALYAPHTLNSDLYPLYPNATWSGVKSATADSAEGFEVVSNPIKNLSNIAASSTPFMDYYKEKLTKAGWTQDMSREAGGPGAEVSVYTKGSEFAIVSFSTVFHTKPKNAPETCPCDLQFTLVSGTAK